MPSGHHHRSGGLRQTNKKKKRSSASKRNAGQHHDGRVNSAQDTASTVQMAPSTEEAARVNRKVGDDSNACRAYIECDSCGAKNAPKRCTQCKCAFYCSVDCQRTDWMGHRPKCVLMARNFRPDDTCNDSSVTPINTECGICLEEPMSNPVVLSKCGHSFCFPCLKDWQEAYPRHLLDIVKRTERIRNQVCPMCRTTMGKSVVFDTLVKAHFLQYRASKVQGEDEKMKLLDEALSEVNVVLESDEGNTDAILIKAHILSQYDPQETIVVATKLLELRKFAVKKERQLGIRIAKAKALHQGGHVALGLQQWSEITEEYGPFQEWSPRTDPSSLFEIRLILAKAYEQVDQRHLAYREYKEMMKSNADPSRNFVSEKHSVGLVSSLGYSRCVFHVGDYDEAICFAQRAVNICREVPGAHKLIAQAQHALACPSGPTAWEKAGHTNTTKCTLMDAVETMYRALAYEAPWDDKNKKINQAYLQDLLDEVDCESESK
jgi:tetratricopeptide (TPR) repeat protein